MKKTTKPSPATPDAAFVTLTLIGLFKNLVDLLMVRSGPPEDIYRHAMAEGLIVEILNHLSNRPDGRTEMADMHNLAMVLARSGLTAIRPDQKAKLKRGLRHALDTIAALEAAGDDSTPRTAH